MKCTQKQKGQSLVEFALILPILVIILGGVLDLGRLYFAYVAVTDAAAEGATYAAIHPGDTDDICARAQTASSGVVEIDEGMVEVDYSALTSGSPITVTVNYSFTVTMPVINAMVDDGVLMLRAVATEAILSGDF